jgi:hypothetical protein
MINKTFKIYVKQKNDKQYREGAVITSRKSGTPLISRPLEAKKHENHK